MAFRLAWGVTLFSAFFLFCLINHCTIHMTNVKIKTYGVQRYTELLIGIKKDDEPKRAAITRASPHTVKIIIRYARIDSREFKIHDERDNDDVYRPREDWNDDVGFGGKMKT